ncbi:ergothioneine biosynthesis protein EgtB [Actinomadura macrotermitis]|uniref:Hercynine oxygenase n=1 Tax=Actinomadura macrotermitis TaxID=2585200 RepID=A0A7K0BQ23_9ACTN|nr:ergothioneine biosynthesis protein EgtB [Actinomadura macrotermitis]MQY03271.1 Hercynine oxygenase [Actinomadura macrotermitis]
MAPLNTLDEHALKERIAGELGAARDRSHGLTTGVLDDTRLTAQVSPLMSPLVWDLAHIGNYEELWLLRAAAGTAPMRPEIDGLYDAFEHPRATRPTLPLLPPAEAATYIATVRAKVLDSLDKVRFDGPDRLTGGGFVYGMVLQHEHMHDETMLATHQLRKDGPALLDPPEPAGHIAPAAASEVLIGAGPFVMGTSDDHWSYDNERPRHLVDLPAYYIDTEPVSNAEYLAFMEAGGYDDPRWWDPKGWEWRQSGGKRAPAFWTREGEQWVRRRFGHVEPIPLAEAVQHVCWYEADAYARWAGKRLPTEAEWEKAASWGPDAQHARRYPWGDDYAEDHANLGQRAHRPSVKGAYASGASAYGVRRMVGDVWEWTSSDFHGYPGFRSFPYKEYSEVFFGPEYKVLRGGSWATHPLAVRNTFRNWDYPIRRQIFSGFRCARDAA